MAKKGMTKSQMSVGMISRAEFQAGVVEMRKFRWEMRTLEKKLKVRHVRVTRGNQRGG
jgi:hypothetical protein